VRDYVDQEKIIKAKRKIKKSRKLGGKNYYSPV
jgi:hypothetical protein